MGSTVAWTGGGIPGFLAQHYVSTLRDMRATYQMAFKAMLFADRLSLSATPASDDGQSELAYMLSQPQAFRGQSHYVAGGVQTHRADFDFKPFAAARQLPASCRRRRHAGRAHATADPGTV